MHILLIALLLVSSTHCMEHTKNDFPSLSSPPQLTLNSSSDLTSAREQRWTDRVSLTSVISVKNDVAGACALFLKRFQSNPSLSDEEEPLHIEMPSSRSTSPLVLGTARLGERIPDSPPKSPLGQEAFLGDLIPERPTLFSIHNSLKIAVYINAILTHPYRPKKYLFGPNDSMIILSPDPKLVQFEQVVAHRLDKEMHPAVYVFKDYVPVNLLIKADPSKPDTIIITQKSSH